MTLEGSRIWLATQGGERAHYYQMALVAGLKALGATSVEVIGVQGMLKSTASDLGTRATDLLESAAGRLARGLKVDRFLSLGSSDEEQGNAGVDLLILDSPALSSMAKASLRVAGSTPFTIGLIDDFTVNTRWRDVAVDLLIVPNEHLVSAHLHPTSGPASTVAGPPVSDQWVTDGDRASAKTTLGVEAGATVVLVSAAGMRADNLERAVFQLTLLEKMANVLFYHDDDDEVAQTVRRAAANYGLKANILGNVDQLETVFAAADILLCDASDPSVLELTLTGRPVVAVGSERGAARTLFLADHSVVTHVEDVLQLSSRLDPLLGSATLEGLEERVKALLSPNGTKNVLDAIVDGYTRREEIKAEKPTRPASAPEPTEKPAVALPDKTLLGAFESVGAPAPAAENEILAPISMAEAKSQMAALIVRERDAERALTEIVKSRDKWMDRAELAKEDGDQDLIQIAQSRANSARTEVGRLNAEIEVIRRSKGKLKARVARSKKKPAPARGNLLPKTPIRPPEKDDVEARFRKMELDREMRRLRRKIEDD